MKKISFVITCFVLCSAVCHSQSKNFTMGSWMEIQSSILKELDRSYVDTLPLKKMQKAAIDAMLSQLDPYTVYVPEEEMEDFSLQIGKVYGGVGAIIYKPEGENVIINEPYAGSPCVKYGLESGDEILEINGEDVKQLDTKSCSDKMKGQPGSQVEFLVKKVYTGDTLKVKVRRERIHLPDIVYSGMLDAHTGYISQTGFTEGVADEFRKRVQDMKSQGMTKLIIDLRGNVGGLLTEAVGIVSIFVPKNSLVVTSRGRDGKERDVYYTQKEPVDTKMDLVVLANGGSASSSEIVCGALQDMDRATIMGTRTFGKGLVQSIFPMPYGGELKVTVAKYYTPSGRCVQAIDYSNRNPDGSVGHIPDSLTHEFKTQKGRIVRDGGGITPDVIIEDPEYDDMVVSLVMSGIVGQYALEYKRSHPSIEPLSDFHFDDMDGFKAFVKKWVKPEVYADVDNISEDQIISFIEEEIVTRYYYQSEAAKFALKYDTQLAEALKTKLVL